MAALSIAEFTAHCSQIPPSLDQATVLAAFQRACASKPSIAPATSGNGAELEDDVDARCAEISAVKLDSAREDVERQENKDGAATFAGNASSEEPLLADSAIVSSTAAQPSPVVGGELEGGVPAFGELHADSLIEFALVDDPAAPGMSKGFGFATFGSPDERDAFIERLDGALLSDIFGGSSLPGDGTNAEGISSGVGEDPSAIAPELGGGDGARLVVAPAKAKKAPAPKKKKKSSAEQDEHVKGLSGGRQWLSKGKKGKATPKHSPTLSTDTNRRYSKCN